MRLVTVLALAAGAAHARQAADPASTGSTAPAAADSLAASIGAWLAPFDEAGELSGTLLVARGDEIVFEQAYGLAHHELGVPMTLDTRIGIASITKPMTIIITLRLAEQGKLAIADVLEDYIPGFANGERITVGHLLNHRAGIPHRVTTAMEETVPMSAADIAERARDTDPLCEPGAQSIYSSAGFTVLTRVCEIAAGKSFAELLDEYVCGPAGLTHTAHADSRTVLTGRAASYVGVAGGVANAPLQDLSFLAGAGSLYSTPRDLFRLQRAVTQGKLGPTVQANVATGNAQWNGATSGFRAFCDYYPDTEVTVSFCGNRVTGAIDRLRAALPRLAAGESVDAPTVPAIEAIAVEGAYLEQFVGVYEPRPGSTFDVRLGDGFLYVGAWTLVPVGVDAFVSPQDYATAQAVYDDDGGVAGIQWGAMYMSRLPDGAQ